MNHFQNRPSYRWVSQPKRFPGQQLDRIGQTKLTIEESVQPVQLRQSHKFVEHWEQAWKTIQTRWQNASS